MSDGISIEAGRVSVLSPAKINWTLRVVGKRQDGFHELESLVSPVTLYDTLNFDNPAEAGFRLTCDVPELPTDESNLVSRAALLLAKRSGRPLSGRCRLLKQIPMGGGLGGGSSNAASALMALNRLWGLDWPKARLVELAAELGSDVALFLEDGPAVISGRGEKVTPVKLGWSGWVLLILPGLHVSTPAVYRAWRATDEARPVEPEPVADAVAWMMQTFNMLEPPAIAVCPPLGALQSEATKIAGRPVRISGSGSTMFTAFDTQAEAAICGERICKELDLKTQAVEPIDRS